MFGPGHTSLRQGRNGALSRPHRKKKRNPGLRRQNHLRLIGPSWRAERRPCGSRCRRRREGRRRRRAPRPARRRPTRLLLLACRGSGAPRPKAENFSTAAPGLRAPALRGRGLPLPRAHALRGGRAVLGGVVWTPGAACSASPPRVCAPRCSQPQTAAHIKSLFS